MNAKRLSIEVCYALPDRQTLLTVELPENATLYDAICASGVLIRHPEIDLTQQKFGVFGKILPLNTLLTEHDRVEIYRPLIIDPKISRQRRAEKARKADLIEGRKWRLLKNSS